ncbi:hypothetical protein V5799_023372 [Amblyomma americanum]|uniref:Uncharacterized protein n=1 Tax=Amblyomma americanum TaxID=6943 RepID=A0AAQ4FJI0_AMBAM
MRKFDMVLKTKNSSRFRTIRDASNTKDSWQLLEPHLDSVCDGSEDAAMGDNWQAILSVFTAQGTFLIGQSA